MEFVVFGPMSMISGDFLISWGWGEEREGSSSWGDRGDFSGSSSCHWLDVPGRGVATPNSLYVRCRGINFQVLGGNLAHEVWVTISNVAVHHFTAPNARVGACNAFETAFAQRRVLLLPVAAQCLLWPEGPFAGNANKVLFPLLELSSLALVFRCCRACSCTWAIVCRNHSMYSTGHVYLSLCLGGGPIMTSIGREFSLPNIIRLGVQFVLSCTVAR